MPKSRRVKSIYKLQAEVARLRQERDAARLQRQDSSNKQPLNRKPLGKCTL